MAILEECLTHDITSVLLIEDDATFIKDFSAKAEQFIANLPQDWSFIYFGGQHIEQDVRLPRRVNDFVYIPYNVNRTHCFALRGRPMMELVYRHLNAIPSWSADHHVDHHLGELHKTLHSGLYVPREWLVGQEPGYSDINGKQWSQLTFRGAEELTSGVVDLQMVAVLGQFRAGTSCVAGILHAVGINMGAKFPKPDAANMSGYFEAEGLANICRMACREPWMTKAMLREDRRNLLRRWAANRCAQLRGDCAITGGKHPSLCFMGPDLLDAWNDPKFVIVDRPINESIDSVLRTRWGWPEAAVRYALPRMIKAREAFLRKHRPRHIRIAYHRLIERPAASIDEITAFLEYTPSDEQRRAAIQTVMRPQTPKAEEALVLAGRDSAAVRFADRAISRPGVKHVV